MAVHSARARAHCIALHCIALHCIALRFHGARLAFRAMLTGHGTVATARL
jgi:hypothetical protein